MEKTDKIKFCYFGSELETHHSANQPLLEELKKRGHSVKIIQWKFSDNMDKIVKSIPDVDIVLGETGVPKKDKQNKSQIWVCVLHGISIFKHNYISGGALKYDLLMLPTEEWKTTRETSCKRKDVLGVPVCITNGWSKYDIYHKYLKNKEQTRDYIYDKYKFDKKKKLIVYVPTGIRPAAPTLKEWKAKGWSESAYQNHGSCYLYPEIEKQIKAHGNSYTIYHPCFNRTDVVKDRIPIMTVADLIIGDISSMTLEASLMDVPIIQIKKAPNDRVDGDFHAFSNPKNELLDFGDIIDVKDLGSTIKARLKEDTCKERRNELKEKYVGICDGKAAQREADALEEYWKTLK